MTYDIPDLAERIAAKEHHDAWVVAVAAQSDLEEKTGGQLSGEVLAGLREIDARWREEREAYLASQPGSAEVVAAQAAVDAAWTEYDGLQRRILGDSTEYGMVCALSGAPIWDDEEVLEGSDGTLVIRSLVLPDEPAAILPEEVAA